jgi:hypothetical protein
MPLEQKLLHLEQNDMDFNQINRRSLLKLMALASPALMTSSAESLETSSEIPLHSPPSQRLKRPRLFYDAASLARLRKALSPRYSKCLVSFGPGTW